jgi:hypothetical protein
MMVMSSALAMLAPTCASARARQRQRPVSFMVFGDPAMTAYDGLVRLSPKSIPA